MVSYRILVTGSRTWDDWEMVRRAFRALEQRDDFNPWKFPVTLVHGGAEGLDKIAGYLAQWEFGWNVEVHPAKWQTHDYVGPGYKCPEWHRKMRTCKMAGHRRNAEMVAARADVCIAFIRNGSPGATGCANLAENSNIPTKRIELYD